MLGNEENWPQKHESIYDEGVKYYGFPLLQTFRNEVSTLVFMDIVTCLY